jgi:hypothetical protein
MVNYFLDAQEQYSETFETDLQLLSLNLHLDGETGSFVTSDGFVYDFAYSPASQEVVAARNDSETMQREDWAEGYLTQQGLPSELFGEDAYGFMQGLNAATGRSDAKCGRGWKPGAGGKCTRAKSKLKQGGVGRKLATGAAIAGGVAAAAGLGAAGGILGGTKAGREGVKKAWGEAKQGGKLLTAPVSGETRARGLASSATEAGMALSEGLRGGTDELKGKIKELPGKAAAKMEDLRKKAEQKSADKKAMKKAKKEGGSSGAPSSKSQKEMAQGSQKREQAAKAGGGKLWTKKTKANLVD